MKTLLAGCVVVSVLSLAGGAFGEDWVITEPGVYKLDPGTEYGQTSNRVAGTVTLESTGDTTAADKIILGGYQQVAKSTTIFNGGFWDFGGGKFNVETTELSYRTNIFRNAAVATNISYYTVGDASALSGNAKGGQYNTTFVTDGAKLYVDGTLMLARRLYESHSALWVTDGGYLYCKGNVTIGDGAMPGNGVRTSGDWLIISNATASAKVTGAIQVASASNNSGDRHLLVTDGAHLDAGSIAVGAYDNTGARCFNSSFIAGENAVVTTKTLYLDARWPRNYDGLESGDRIEIRDGAFVRVTDEFKCGYGSDNQPGPLGAKLIISNATLSCQVFTVPAASASLMYHIHGTNSKIRVTGTSPFRPFNSMTNKKTEKQYFHVEHGADYTANFTAYSYDMSRNGNVVVREGSTFRFNALTTGNAYNGARLNLTNKLDLVENSVATGGQFCVCGAGNELNISNSVMYLTSTANNDFGNNISSPIDKASENGPALSVGGPIRRAGSPSVTNCWVNLRGTTPKIKTLAGASASFRAGGKLRFVLPAGGYAEGYVPVEIGKNFKMWPQSGCELILEGVEEFFRDAPSMRYKLVECGGVMTIDDDILDAARATLPDGVKLAKRTSGGKTSLVLYKPAGALILVR